LVAVHASSKLLLVLELLLLGNSLLGDDLGEALQARARQPWGA